MIYRLCDRTIGNSARELKRIAVTNKAHAAEKQAAKAEMRIANIEGEAHALSEEASLLLKEKRVWKEGVNELEDETISLRIEINEGTQERDVLKATNA
jgi:hypothetical protein